MKMREIPIEKAQFIEEPEAHKNPAWNPSMERKPPKSLPDNYLKQNRSGFINAKSAPVDRPAFVEPIQEKTSTPVDIEQKSESTQKAQVQLKAKKLPEPPKNAEAPPQYVYTRSDSDSEYERLGLPSNCIFYDFDSILMREFEAYDLSLIVKALEREDFSIMVDAIGNTIQGDVDIRSLTTKDFYYIMYHHRLRDYPSSPYNIPWTSRYGNDNTSQINMSDLNITTIGMTKEDYQKYKDAGICYPTVRDLEVLQSKNLEPDHRWLIERAQWTIGENLEEKMNKVSKMKVRELETIRNFKKDSEHGVVERVTVKDDKFEPNKAIIYLREQSNKLEEILKTIDVGVDEIRDKIKELQDEANEIEKLLSEGVEVLPADEEVELVINALRFFPAI